MPTPSVGLPFDWHLPPVSTRILRTEDTAARDVTALHALQLSPHSPYADVHELWAQGQSLDIGPEMPTMCACQLSHCFQLWVEACHMRCSCPHPPFQPDCMHGLPADTKVPVCLAPLVRPLVLQAPNRRFRSLQAKLDHDRAACGDHCGAAVSTSQSRHRTVLQQQFTGCLAGTRRQRSGVLRMSSSAV